MVMRRWGELGTNSSQGKRRTSKNPQGMHEPLSPELVLVDPDLAARARADLPDSVARSPRVFRSAAPPVPDVEAPRAERVETTRPYPLWARVTAALWLLVIGILIGGAAIPHAQDTPRVVPPAEDAPGTICEPPPTIAPTIPGGGGPVRPGS